MEYVSEKSLFSLAKKIYFMPKFNPDEPHETNGNFAGLPHLGEKARIVYLPIPWDATTSGRKGAAKGPENILRQSLEIDLFDQRIPEPWNFGHQFLEIEDGLIRQNKQIGEQVERYRQKGFGLAEINKACATLNDIVYKKVIQWMSDNRLLGVVGGDHSLSLGSIRAHLEFYPGMQVIQLDAHMDLRKAYEGLKYSHASVFYNVLNELPLSGLFQMGVRDFCREEWTLAQKDERVHVLTAEDIAYRKAGGSSLKDQFREFLNTLSKEVYLSLDVDVLQPYLCPGTGTPVPGGLGFWNILQILDSIHESGRKLVGFDLVESGGSSYIDGFTSAKLLYLIASRAYFMKHKHA